MPKVLHFSAFILGVAVAVLGHSQALQLICLKCIVYQEQMSAAHYSLHVLLIAVTPPAFLYKECMPSLPEK